MAAPTAAPSASHALAPVSSSSINKPPIQSPTSLQTPSIFTNKEWVIPPRPKPGRKPAVDTPPTKRKAQNRAAQRAFRERRAARVGELEDQMQQIEEDNERERECLQTRMHQLEADVDHYTRLADTLNRKCEGLERQLAHERNLRLEAEERRRLERETKTGGNDAVPLRPRNVQRGPISDTEAPKVSRSPIMPQKDEPLGCGNCSFNTRCECIEQAFEMGDIAQQAPSATTFKRLHSPASLSESKRNRHSSAADLEPAVEEREIDFTEQFSAKRPPTVTSVPSSSLTAIIAPDPCGFCQDGTACICAEMSTEEKACDSNIKIPDFESASMPIGRSQSPCMDGPGSCQQCRSDPNSTLFCKSLAASRSNAVHQPPQGQALDVAASRLKSNAQLSSQQAMSGIRLTCADAFATLSRHPGYERASENPEAWLPKLTTIPGGAERPAFEVEAASVMQTLRFFDRRFGRGV